jgi:hypothetical protein
VCVGRSVLDDPTGPSQNEERMRGTNAGRRCVWSSQLHGHSTEEKWRVTTRAGLRSRTAHARGQTDKTQVQAPISSDSPAGGKIEQRDRGRRRRGEHHEAGVLHCRPPNGGVPVAQGSARAGCGGIYRRTCRSASASGGVCVIWNLDVVRGLPIGGGGRPGGLVGDLRRESWNLASLRRRNPRSTLLTVLSDHVHGDTPTRPRHTPGRRPRWPGCLLRGCRRMVDGAEEPASQPAHSPRSMRGGWTG